MDYMFTDYGLIIISMIIAMGAQWYINHNYSKYSKQKNTDGITGYETARKILDNNGLENVGINMVDGKLTDHYDPRNKTVNLSTDIYNSATVAAVSVAAHECGHAIQDKNGYLFLKLRRSIIPVVNFASYAGYFAVVIGLLFSAMFLIRIGILLECIILAFQLITLPVEFNASNRGLNQIKELNLLDKNEYYGARKMLKSAALTYVAGVASALIQVLRLVMILRRRSDD
ncbi:MAG: zinc metallopeptidase [Clostridia bacterium]|nr:zinc metallopeptidase [Clostridia bacterium]